MHLLEGIRDWVTRLGRRSSRESDLELEIQSHLEMEVARHRATGVPEREALRMARLKFGGVERVREECRDAGGQAGFEDFMRDLWHGVRSIRSAPSFAVAALLTLALGIGGPAAILGAVRGMLLEPLPYPDVERLVYVWQTSTREPGEMQEVSPANFLDWRSRSKSFEGIAALEPTGVDWQSDAGPVALSGWIVYEGFFDLIGVAPLLGRTFGPGEHTAGRANVIMLSHDVWHKRFSGDSTIVGRTLQLEGEPWTVIGVMPADFAVPERETVWVPKVIEGWESQARSSGFYKVVARIRADARPGEAAAEMDAIALQLAGEFPIENGEVGVAVVPFREQILGQVEGPLMVLTVAVLLVFLICCANLSNLQLARALYRNREFAIRGALGAGPRRIIRQLIAESLVLTTIGCLLGFLFATVSLEVVRFMAPPDMPRLEQLHVDGWVLVFAAVGALIAAFVTGMVPIGTILRRNTSADLAGGGRGTTATRAARKLGASLVVAEIALSLVLLIGAGLLLRSFIILLDEDRGFRSEGVAVLVTQVWSYLPTGAEQASFVRDATTRMSALPGVQSAAVASLVPMAAPIGAESATYRIPGHTEATTSPPAVVATRVTPGYFETLGIPLVSGREFDVTDQARDHVVVIISKSLAEAHWDRDQSPLGRTINLSLGNQTFPCDIVGVVADVRRDALNKSPRPTVYLSFDQAPTGACAFFIRSSADPHAAIAQAKEVIWSLHPTLPIDSEDTLESIVGDTLQERRFVLLLIGLFASLAFAMAVIGTFGLISYATAARTREIGVRMAFGASGSQVLMLILSQAGRLAVIGILLGLAGAVVLTRFLGEMLYGIGAADPMTYVAGALALLLAALLACWIPAARAARLDPVVALRVD